MFIDESGNLYELSFLERGIYAPMSGINQVEQVAVGSDKTLLILKSDGSLWVEGSGQKGELGTGVLADSQTFLKVPLDKVVEIGFYHDLAIAVQGDGILWAWGQDRETTGSEEIWRTPQQISQIKDAKNVSAGDGLNILHKDGSVTAWIGGNFHPIEKLPSIVQIDGALQYYNLGVASDGALWAWGTYWANAMFSNSRQIPEGSGTGPDRFQGHLVGLKDTIQVASSGTIILTLEKNGTVWAWGANSRGEGGNGMVDSIIDKPTRIIIAEP